MDSKPSARCHDQAALTTPHPEGLWMLRLQTYSIETCIWLLTPTAIGGSNQGCNVNEQSCKWAGLGRSDKLIAATEIETSRW